MGNKYILSHPGGNIQQASTKGKNSPGRQQGGRVREERRVHFLFSLSPKSPGPGKQRVRRQKRAWSSLTAHLRVESLTKPICHLRTERDSWCSSIWQPPSSRPPPAPTHHVILYLFRLLCAAPLCSLRRSAPSTLHSSRLLYGFWRLESGHSPLNHQSSQDQLPLNVLSELHGWLRGAQKQ